MPEQAWVTLIIGGLATVGAVPTGIGGIDETAEGGERRSFLDHRLFLVGVRIATGRRGGRPRGPTQAGAAQPGMAPGVEGGAV